MGKTHLDIFSCFRSQNETRVLQSHYQRVFELHCACLQRTTLPGMLEPRVGLLEVDQFEQHQDKR